MVTTYKLKSFQAISVSWEFLLVQHEADCSRKGTIVGIGECRCFIRSRPQVIVHWTHGLLRVMRAVRQQMVDRWFDQIWVHNELAFRNNSTWLMNVPIVALGSVGLPPLPSPSPPPLIQSVSIITNATAVRTVGLSSVHYPAPRILSIRRNVWVVRTRHEASRTRPTPPTPRALPVRVKHFMITPAQITERTVRTPNHQFSER